MAETNQTKSVKFSGLTDKSVVGFMFASDLSVLIKESPHIW